MTFKDAIKTPEYRELIRFFKKEKLYSTFQRIKYEVNKKQYVVDKIILDAMEYIGDYVDVVNTITKGRLKCRNHLVVSQLWRFFILEEIEKGNFEPELFNVRDLGMLLKAHIQNNGYRGSDTVKQLFKKHGFKSNKIEDREDYADLPF